MTTCGYLCPACNGTGFVELDPCSWCGPQKKKEEISDEEWMKQVHEGPCCGDWGSENH